MVERLNGVQEVVGSNPASPMPFTREYNALPTAKFPARNRIVAGLCAATVVVEARERSGALITADLALEEGREVFAVPGEITSSLSAGTNALLKLGATPLTSAVDVLAWFGMEPEAPTDATSPLLEFLPASTDELVRKTGLGADEYKGVFNAALRLTALLCFAAFVLRMRISREYVAVALPTGTMLTLVGRYVARKAVHRLRRGGRCTHSVVAVGSPESTSAMSRRWMRLSRTVGARKAPFGSR